MPPALSDDEASDANLGPELSPSPSPSPELEVPLRSARATGSAARNEEDDGVLDLIDSDLTSKKADTGKGANNAAKPQEEGDENDEEDEAEEDEYIVEKIIEHKINTRGKISFKVKWEGYHDEEDMTWEPEENLAEAPDVVEAYYKVVGTREELIEQFQEAKSRTKKRGRPSTGATPTAATKRSRKNGDHPANGTPPASAKAAAWKPPSGSWEDEIETIDACEDEETGKLIVYLNWKNGQKTKHGTDVIYKRCPQKMLHFYEQHIRIIKNAPEIENEL